MLLGAICSDTVLLTSPTTTERDRVATSWLEQLLSLDAIAFGREMFERSSDVVAGRRPRTSSCATSRSTSSTATAR